MSTYLLALLLLVPTQLPPATKPSEMDLAKMRREAGEKKMERMKELIKSKERPIEFYGQVLDQFDHPVEGLDVEVHTKQFSPNVEGWFMNFKRFWTETDGQGRFGVLNERGIELFVHDLKKEGYAKLSLLPDADGPDYTYGFDYANEIKPFIPDQKHPITFHVRKMGPTTFLLKNTDFDFRIPPAKSGKVIGYDFVQQRKIREADKPTTPAGDLVRDIQLKATFNTSDETWTVTFSSGTPGGGIIVSEQLLYEAPETGYQPEYTFVPEDRKPVKARYIYVRSRDPAIYTRIEVEHDITANKQVFDLVGNSVTNPYGERNLEQTPNLPPNLYGQLSKEAKNALSRGRRPAKPDLPRMIPEAKDSWLRAQSQHRELLRQQSLENAPASNRALLTPAIEGRDSEAIQQLLDKGVDPNEQVINQSLTVHTAMGALAKPDEARRWEVLATVIQKGGQLQLCPMDQAAQAHQNRQLLQGEWCLIVAGMLKAGKPAVVEQLLRSSPDVQAVPSEGSRVLGQALELKCFDLAEWLMDKGVRPNQRLKDNMPWTQIITAQRRGVLERLLAEKPRINHGRYDCRTPLNLACKLGWADGMDLLLSHGADAGPAYGNIISPIEDVLLFAPDPRPCLEVAIRRGALLDIRAWVALGDLAKVKEILQADRRAVRGPRPQVLTPLHVAVRRSQIQIARLLLDTGADVDELGNTLLEPKELLEVVSGPRTGGLSASGPQSEEALKPPAISRFTPLQIATILGDADTVRFLLERGANANTETAPLEIAAAQGHLDCCKILLEHAADVQAADSNKRTPLHRAASGGHVEMIRLLAQYHADIDVRDVRGRTPLHYAVASTNQEAVRAMLAAGADPTIADNDGRPPSRFPGDWHMPDETRLLLVKAEQAGKQSRAASTRP